MATLYLIAAEIIELSGISYLSYNIRILFVLYLWYVKTAKDTHASGKLSKYILLASR
jgi:hypothetical protein